MKKLLLVLAAAGTITSIGGCVAVPADVGVSVSGNTRGEYAYPQGQRRERDHDRDGDGVPNRQDRRPDNPNRY
jgi:hypothetical protein